MSEQKISNTPQKKFVKKFNVPPKNNNAAKGKKIKGLALRQTASKILSAVLDKKLSLDGLLDDFNGHPHYLELHPKDRSLCRAILYTALRHHISLDKQLNSYLKNPLPKSAIALRHILHIGAAQILYLRIPAYAAIHLTVEAAKADPRNRRFSGLINAILRKFVKDGEKYPLDKNPCEHVPKWFTDMLLKTYSKDHVQKIIIAQNTPPNLDITVKENPDIWAEKLNAYSLGGNHLRLKEPNQALTTLPGFEDGSWFVQNIAASLPVRIMGTLKGKKVADLCAAPGGKTAQLALAQANVTAMEIVQTRLERLKENMKRLNLKVKTWQGDFRQYPEKAAFDIVLLDAPCSSTGTIRRHIDVLWTKDEAELEKLARIQYQLLEASLDLVKKGGHIIFSNCSLAREEGEEIVTKILSKHKNLRLAALSSEEFPDLKDFISSEGYLRTDPSFMPHEDPNLGGMDGFFAARLLKIE